MEKSKSNQIKNQIKSNQKSNQIKSNQNYLKLVLQSLKKKLINTNYLHYT